LIFWPLHLLVQHAVAMLRPVCFYAVKDGRCVHPDLRREGVMWYSCRYPVVVEVWTLSWWNDRSHVGLEHGFHAPVHCARSCPSHWWEWAPWWGPRSSSPCQRVLRVPWMRGKHAKRVRHSRAYITGVGRGGDCSRRGIRVGRFDDVMGARARRKASLSLGRFSS
jgi:hypothetical protein